MKLDRKQNLSTSILLISWAILFPIFFSWANDTTSFGYSVTKPLMYLMTLMSGAWGIYLLYIYALDYKKSS